MQKEHGSFTTDNPVCPNASSLEQEEQLTSDIQFSLWRTFKGHIPRFILTILFDLVLPLVIYFVLEKRMKSVYALLIAGTPPLVMILLKLLQSRTLDPLGLLVFLSFLISAIVALVTKNPIVLLLEKSLVTGFLSIAFGITLIPFRCCKSRCRWRPAAYYFYQDLVPTKREQVGLPDSLFDNQEELSKKGEVAQVYEWIYTNCPSFRYSCYIITSIWCIGFLLEFLTRLILILVHISMNRIVIYANVILTTITVLCIISTIICIVKERKRTLPSIKQAREEHLNTQRQLRRLEGPVWTVDMNSNENYMIDDNKFVSVIF
jgi:hypothetical protein